MDTEIEVRKMECKEIRVDVRTASIKESTEGQRQTKILFQINHTMPFTDEYNHLLKELFGNNLGDGSMISPPLNGACVGSVKIGRNGIKLMSWYPLGHGDTALMNELVFAGLGKKYGKTPAQVILRWHTQMGFVVIPGSKNAEHIKDNMDIFDFALTDEEMEQIAKLDKNERYYHRTDEQLVQFANWKPEFEK